ncbi:MAG: FecR domain-containing protein [Chthoniobacterales bacterium]
MNLRQLAKILLTESAGHPYQPRDSSAFRRHALQWCAAATTALIATGARADVLKEARVSQVIKDVQLLQSNGAPRAATTRDVVRQGTAVRTGADSRAELTFTDLTIARMGANTIFSFDEGTRTVDLANGAILLRVPKGSGGAKVQTAAVTAAITGTTVMVEYHKGTYAKFICLEGTMRVYLKGHLGESVLVAAGQMLIVNPNATRLADPVDVDLDRLVRTSLLLAPPFGPLGSETLMAGSTLDQLGKKTAGTLLDTNLVIFGRGTLVTMVDPASLDVVDQARAAGEEPSPTATPRPTSTPQPTATPTPSPQPTPTPSPTSTPSATPAPTPSKFGTPSVITSFIPYPIDNGTLIQTDPAITRAGVTDFGKIYRDTAQDGPFSAWAFGTTSPFDTSSNFDALFVDTSTGNVPMAVFKFANLTLSGNPSVTLASGGVPNLGLVSVLGITSTPAGDTTFTFSGMHTVLLAAQNGSIQLSGISFQNINTLIMYARGTGSNLSLAAPISGVTQLRLFAEGDIQINDQESVTAFRATAGNDFLTGTGPISAQSVFVSTGRDINFSAQQFSVGAATGNTLFLGAGRNLNIDISGDQSVFSNAASVTLNGTTINIIGEANPVSLGLGTAADNFNAGTGGFQAPTIGFEHAAFDPANANQTLNLRSAGDIRVFAIADANLVQASGSINASDSIGTNTITAGQSITTGGDLVAANSITAGTTISAGSFLLSPLVSAGGNVNADTVEVLQLNAANGVLTAGNGGIIPFLDAGPGAQHRFTVNSIVSPNGIDFSGNSYALNGFPAPQGGGNLTINATTLTFDTATGIAFANFNGSDETAGINQAGSGGTFTTLTSGNTTVNAPITATTGLIPNNGSFSGAGGNVSLGSTNGAVTVNSVIQVSSDDARNPVAAPPANVRESASGGNVTLHSDLTTGTGIVIGRNGQVLSLLNSKAPGPGGSILLSTKGADITVSGQLVADRGTVTISQNDPAGVVQLDDSATIAAETLDIFSAGNVVLGTGASPTINAVTVTVHAPQDISGFGLSLDSVALNSDGNYMITADGNISLAGDVVLSHTNGARANGLDTTFSAGGTLSVTGMLTATSSATTDGAGLSGGGGNIAIGSGGDMSIGNGMNLSTFIEANTGTGANIDVTAGNALTASLSLRTEVDVATLNSGANVSLTTGGNIQAVGGEGSVVLFATNSSGNIGSGANLSVRDAGSLTTPGSGVYNLQITNRGTIGTGANISSSIGGDLTAGGVFASIDNSAGGRIGSGANIDWKVGGDVNVAGAAELTVVNSQPASFGTIDSPIAVNIAANSFTIGGSLNAYVDNIGGMIGKSEDEWTLTLNSTGPIKVGTLLNVFGTVTAGGDITAQTIALTNATTPGNINAGSGGITRFTIPFEPMQGIAHVLNANLVTSQNGINFDGATNVNGFGPFDGGNLTLNISAFSTTIAGGAGANVIGNLSFNGGGDQTTVGANGGSFTVNSTGAITIGSNISATSGLQAQGAAPSGNGGSVDLGSANEAVVVNAPIQVSSADAASGAATRRRSNSGGRINLHSGATGVPGAQAVAINISNTGQLLSLLDAAATGPGGKVTLLATGTNSSINVNGNAAGANTIQADRGAIDIRHTGDGGQITFNNANLRADNVRVGAFGTNGSLTIGGGTISADTILKLYATGSNGAITFIANATLTGNSVKTIAANTVTVNNNVIVTIGGGKPADVYTEVPNYAAFNGGNGATTGRFLLGGASSPTSGVVTQPATATPPPFGGPGGP